MKETETIMQFRKWKYKLKDLMEVYELHTVRGVDGKILSRPTKIYMSEKAYKRFKQIRKEALEGAVYIGTKPAKLSEKLYFRGTPVEKK